MMAYLTEFASQMQKHTTTYWRGAPYPWIIAAAVLAGTVLAVKRKDRIAALLTGMTLFLLLLIFCPLSAVLIQKVIGADIYWRMLWLVPWLPLTCYVSSVLIGLLPERGVLSKVLRTAAVLAVCLLIAGAGKLQYTSGDFYKTANGYQIPDDVYQIAELINADRRAEGRADEPVTAAAVDEVAAYLRLYDPTIHMPYGRRAHGALSRNEKKLYWRIQKANRPKKLAERAHAAHCDYLVLIKSPKDKKFLKKVMKRGYDYLGEVGAYTVLKENAAYAAEFSPQEEPET